MVTHYTYRGTHAGELVHPAVGRLAPTGREFTAQGMDLYRMRDGKIAELRQRTGIFEVLQQLGAIPAPARATG